MKHLSEEAKQKVQQHLPKLTQRMIDSDKLDYIINAYIYQGDDKSILSDMNFCRNLAIDYRGRYYLMDSSNNDFLAILFEDLKTEHDY